MALFHAWHFDWRAALKGRSTVVGLMMSVVVLGGVAPSLSPCGALAGAQGCSCEDTCWNWVCSPEGCVVTGPTDFCRYPGLGCPPGETAVGTCCQLPACPILIDTAGDGFALTDPASGVWFAIGPTNMAYQIAWTEPGSDDAWLVLDRNNNGAIDGAAELFGNFTEQPELPNPWDRHGYLALAEFDRAENGGNQDGVIDRRDSVFRELRLWRDKNHDGVSSPRELHTLETAGVRALSLDYRMSRRTDQFGNVFRYWARVRGDSDSDVGKRSVDVFLKVRSRGTTQ